MSSVLPIPQQLYNSDTLTNTKDVTSLLTNSFMQPCYMGALYVDDPISKTLSICDHAVLMDDKLLLISEKNINVTHEQGLTKKKIKRARQDAIYAAHHQLTEAVNHVLNVTDIYTDKAGTTLLSLPENITIHLLCITDIEVTNHDKTLTVTHHYGSDYFLEDCVLDYDDETHATQIFSLGDITTIIDNLPTMPDFSYFLAFHKTYVVSGSSFDNELQILGSFIDTGEVLLPARGIETDLVNAGLRPSIDPKLTVEDDSEQTEQFVTMRKNATFWNQLVSMFAQQIPREGWQEDNSYRALLMALMNESVYSRNNLVRSIADFTQADAEQKREGYIIHMRSYSHDARHYVLLFYSNDSSHPNHRETAKHRLQNVASGVNFHVQEPHLNEIIVIGIADNQHSLEKPGSFGVDMYYMPGSEIDEKTRAEIVAAQQAQLQKEKHVKSQTPVDFSYAGNIIHKNNTRKNAPPSTQNVRPIQEKNMAAKRYDDIQGVNNDPSKPNLNKRKGIQRFKINIAKANVSYSA